MTGHLLQKRIVFGASLVELVNEKPNFLIMLGKIG